MPEILRHKIPEPEPSPPEEPYGATPRGEIGLEKKKKKKEEDILEHKIPGSSIPEKGPYAGTPRGEIGLEESRKEEEKIALPPHEKGLALPAHKEEGVLQEHPRPVALPEHPRAAALPEHERQTALPPHERPKALPPHEELPPTGFEKRKKVVFADISDVIEQEARDAAATAMTEEREKLKGFKGALKRFWKHSFLDGYYRNRELYKARREIQETKNIYVAEEADQKVSEQAKSVIMERFADEHTKEMLGAGEEKEFHNDLKKDVLGAINEYARTGDDNVWQAKCSEVLEKVAQKHNLKGRALLESVNYVNNLYKIAQETRYAYVLGEKQGRAQEALLEDIEIIWGKAKSSVRTEADFNRLDRVIEKVEKSRVAGKIAGIFGNEFAVAAGLSIAYCLARRPLETVLRTRAAKWATFGAGVAVTAGLAGARESHRIEAERRAHFRDRAKGKTFEKGKAPRREEMEKYRYDTLGAGYLTESLQGLYKKYDPSGERELRTLDDTEKDTALKLLAEIESRTKLMDEHKIDLIHYSDLSKVEEERFKLNLLRAQLKVDLRKSDPRGFDQKLETAANTNADFLLKEGDESILEKDRLFKKMKRKKVAKTVCKVMGTGLVFGALAQEAGAFVFKKQEGLVEGLIKGRTKGERLTALAKLKEVIAGDTTKGEIGWVKNFNVGEKVFKVTLPQGADLIDPEGDGIFKLVYNGKDVYDGIHFNPNGTIAKESIDALTQKGIHIDNSVMETVKGFADAGGVDGKTAREEFIDKNPELFQKVKRTLWYDNDTPKPLFDKNELKLWWGGDKGLGINDKGDFVFNIKQMKPDGSFHTPYSIDAQQAMKAGKLKMLLSLSRDTQNNVIEVPISPNGDAIITKGSDAAKMMLEKGADGKAIFLGKYAEVAEMMPGKSKDGRGLMRILATHIGEETGKPPKVPVPERVPIPIFELPRSRPEDVLPFIPVFGRYPLERARREREPIVVPPYYYGGPASPEMRRVFEQRRSETLTKDPEVELDHFQEAERYIENFSEEHRVQVEDLAEQAGDMSPEARLSICIPVAGHQEGGNIYESLKNYTYQTADRSKFELVLFVNHPDKDSAGREIKPDNTREEIKRFKNDFPDVKVAVMYSVLSGEQAKIGGIRKLLNDAALLRHHQRGADVPDLIMVSNDADNKGIAPEYVENFIDKFNENPKIDGMLGQLDWDPESYTKHPLVHIGTRLFQYLSVIGRHRTGSMVSSGANFAFRSSIYAAVGGYITELPGGEDVAVGQAIIEARKSKDRIKFAGARTSRLFTSSRRAIKALEAGRAPVEQWDAGFSAFDDAIRKLELGQGRVLDYDDAEALGKLKSDLTCVINRTLDAYEKGEKLGKGHAFYRKALGWLGIKYKLNQAGDVVITDMSLLVDGLKEYQKLGVLIRDAKSGKKEAIEELKGARAATRGRRAPKQERGTVQIEPAETGGLVFQQEGLRDDSVPSDTLRENSEAALSPEREIEGYFNREGSAYVERLESLSSQVEEPMDKGTRVVVCIPVAGHQEEKNIYKTLQSYAEQKTDFSNFEVLLLVNVPAGLAESKSQAVRNTSQQIERAKMEFPELKIHNVFTVLPDVQARIGNIRKILTDLALLRQQKAGIDRDLLLLSNDADNEGLSPDYINSYIDYFERNPDKEGAVGNLRFDPNAFVRLPVLHLRQEAATLLDQVGFRHGNVDLFGANSVMKSSIYAAIGGYPTALRRGEQEWTGDTIRRLRNKNTTLGFVEEALLTTSSRRGVATVLAGRERQLAFGDEQAEAEMRALDIESFPMFDWEDTAAIDRLKSEFENVINEIITDYEVGEQLGKDAPYYKSNFEKIGIKYNVKGDPRSPESTIKITDMSKFIEHQKKMQESIRGGEKNMAKVFQEALAT